MPTRCRRPRAAAADLLEIRGSSDLFRLGSLAAIQDKVSFLPAAPGVVAMVIDDTVGADADPALDGVLVVFNASPDPATITGTGPGWTLHEVQASGADDVVKQSVAAADAVTRAGPDHGGVHPLRAARPRVPAMRRSAA